MDATSNASVMADRLDEWNDTLSHHIIPASVILMIYLVIGIIGNSIVIYIHTVRLQNSWEERFFIPVLAVIDLISCVVSTSFSFSINMLPVKYSNDSACKVMFFLNMTCTLMSALMLVVIAINRYRKICKPFSKQMNMFWKKIAIACVIGVSLVMSWPCFFFYGSREVYDDHSYTRGYRCTSVRGPWSTVQPLIFKAAVMLIVAFILVSLVVFYVLIGRIVFKQMLSHKKNSSNVGAAAETMSRDCKSSHSANTSKVTELNDTNNRSMQDNPNASDSGNTSDTVIESKSQTVNSESDEKVQNNHLSVTNKNCHKMSSTPTNAGLSRPHGVRLSLIFMLITLVFIICYVPKVGMMIYESRNERFWIELSPLELSGYRFIYTAFIINNIVNPIIYGFLDRRFRNEAYSMCRRGKK
ncbi:C5a anaphylatoxin chemotactic receptor 1-like [Pecten maximus]|uniref:C5a anaphylatoxin chemotactic receptor 1-like n=1 Tax=Pecten maximus TaxID=6579 RepID=UPI00145843B5|nr:C5a anaphylatoxin chemotactic receptor 1-like [Pecten maximus]